MTTLPNTASPTSPPRPAAEVFTALADNIGLALRGKPEVVDLALMCLMAEGHLLIEDVPGVGKISLVKAMARSIDCDFGRIQFTPDLLPTDVVGVSVWNRDDHTFEFRPGPVFAGLVLADEINRASPKTQSALLEAMAESQVTVDGTTYQLPSPFMVVATQNPVEHEGTYPLPESQMDRFLIRTAVGYPSPTAEMEILDSHSSSSDPVDQLRPVATAAEVRAMAAEVRSVHAAPALRSYLTEVAAATRHHPQLTLGMSPRATLALLRAAKARAVVAGRSFVIPDDVHAMAGPVLDHRLICSPAAQMAGLRGSHIVAEVLSAVTVPGTAS